MITEILSKYHSLSRKDQHHRIKSWEHCNSFFMNNYKYLKKAEMFDHGCLHLGFYLVSCGLGNGSSFLLEKDYKVHGYFLTNVVMNSDYYTFFDRCENGRLDYKNILGMDNLIADTRRAYQDHALETDGLSSIHVTDSLASNILLGVFGNTPAFDRYFNRGLTLFDIRTQFNEFSLKELVDFYNQHFEEFNGIRKLFSHDGICYTPMKLLDMFFWQIGFMMDHLETHKEEIEAINEFAEQYKAARRKLNAVPVPL